MAPFGHFSGLAGGVALAVIVDADHRAHHRRHAAAWFPTPLREAAAALGMPRSLVIQRVAYRAARAGLITGVLLAIARITGETAPLLFTALDNQFCSLDLNSPMSSLPLIIYEFALQPLRRLAAARLDRRADHHRGGARAVDLRARAFGTPEDAEMTKFRDHDRAARPDRDGWPQKDRHSRPQFLLWRVDWRSRASICRSTRNKVTAFIGPSGCGKSTLLRVLNRMYDLYPNQRAEGEVLLDGENILDAGPGPQSAARASRHGVPEADAVSDVDLRQHRLRHPALRKAAQIRARRPRRSTR